MLSAKNSARIACKGESEESIAGIKIHKSVDPFWVLSADVTRSTKQRYQWHPQKVLVPLKNNLF